MVYLSYQVKGDVRITKTKEELIAYYERHLEKVIAHWRNSWNGDDYIQQAKDDLEAVKKGRKW